MAKRLGAPPHSRCRKDMQITPSPSASIADPHSPAVRALRPRQLSPSSSMRHRCRLPTTAQRRRCCCPRAQCRPHEAFSSSSSRWHAAPAGVCCHCNRAVRLRRVVMSCVSCLSVHLRRASFCNRCRQLKPRVKRSILEYVILQGSSFSPY